MYQEGRDLDEDDAEVEEDQEGQDYNYLLGMPLWSLTRERKEALLKQKEEKVY